MYIYQQIDRYKFQDAFRDANRGDNFTYEGLNALYEYLTEYAEGTGEPVELDVIALCCEYSEMEDLADYNQRYNTEYTSIDQVEEQTTVIRTEGDAFIILDH